MEFWFFSIFSPARQAALLKFSDLVSLFSGPEGLLIMGGTTTPPIGCFVLCDVL